MFERKPNEENNLSFFSKNSESENKIIPWTQERGTKEIIPQLETYGYNSVRTERVDTITFSNPNSDEAVKTISFYKYNNGKIVTNVYPEFKTEQEKCKEIQTNLINMRYYRGNYYETYHTIDTIDNCGSLYVFLKIVGKTVKSLNNSQIKEMFMAIGATNEIEHYLRNYRGYSYSPS